MSDRPVLSIAEISRQEPERDNERSAALSPLELAALVDAIGVDRSSDRVASEAPPRPTGLGQRVTRPSAPDYPVQLDAELGPVDLGLPLLLDLGAGEAPYDDGVALLEPEALGRGGFSDSVIQLVWRQRMAPSWSVIGGASMFREQDLGILDGLGRARFGWALLGIGARF